MIYYGDSKNLEASEILYNSQMRICFLAYKGLIYFFSLKVQALFCVTQLLYQLLHIYKIYKIYTLKH